MTGQVRVPTGPTLSPQIVRVAAKLMIVCLITYSIASNSIENNWMWSESNAYVLPWGSDCRSEGKHWGKPSRLSEKQQRKLNWVYSTEDYPIGDLSETFTVARATIYRTLESKTMLLRHFHCVLYNPGEFSFKVSAKTARLFWRERIANSESVIAELIKNAYDADAKVCFVFFDQMYAESPFQVNMPRISMVFSSRFRYWKLLLLNWGWLPPSWPSKWRRRKLCERYHCANNWE